MNTHNSTQRGRNTVILIALLLVVGLSGCALLGEATLLEGALGRTALRSVARREIAILERSGLRLAGSDLVIADAATFRSTMAGIRMQRSMLGRPQLYLPLEAAPFAEVLSGNSVRMLRTNQQLTLPGTLHTVKGNRVNVRVGPGTEYRAFRQVNSDRMVLVEATEPGWARVQLDDEVGWIAAALLGALIAEDQDQQR